MITTLKRFLWQIWQYFFQIPLTKFERHEMRPQFSHHASMQHIKLSTKYLGPDDFLDDYWFCQIHTYQFRHICTNGSVLILELKIPCYIPGAVKILHIIYRLQLEAWKATLHRWIFIHHITPKHLFSTNSTETGNLPSHYESISSSSLIPYIFSLSIANNTFLFLIFSLHCQ
jgi:hypothetical protein